MCNWYLLEEIVHRCNGYITHLSYYALPLEETSFQILTKTFLMQSWCNGDAGLLLLLSIRPEFYGLTKTFI